MNKTFTSKSKAQAMAKLANLQVYQHPADVITMQVKPMLQQNLQIKGQLTLDQDNYTSSHHEWLIKELNTVRKSDVCEQELASREYTIWK